MVPRGHRQGCQRHRELAFDAQRLAAGRQDPQLWCPPQQRVCHLGARIEKVLAVVQHQQHLLAPQRLRQRVQERPPPVLLDVEHRGHRLRHQRRVSERCQVHQPDAVGVRLQRLTRELQGEPCLAHPRRPGEDQQARRGEQAAQRGERLLAPDEAGELQREIVARGGVALPEAAVEFQ